MAKEYMKKCSPSLAIMELPPTRTQVTTNVGKDAGKKGPSSTAGRNVS
jgi:hypothetical protein